MEDGGGSSSRRDGILDRAFELTRESGLAGLTMKKVAERVGVTEPALYRHFPNKQALVVGIAERLAEKLLGPARAIAAETEIPPERRLERILTHHAQLVIDTNGLPFLLLAEVSVSDNQDVAATLGAAMKAYHGLVTGVIAEMPRSPGMPEPADLLPFLIGFIAAVAIQRRAMPGLPVDPATVLDMIPFLVRRLTHPEPFPEEEREENS